jgi:hypothetical protein
MKESNLMKTIQLALGKLPHVKLFRNNVAMAWVGESRAINGSGNRLVINARPLHAGLCEGSSDLIGWTEVTITPEMVGRKFARFTAVEVKTDTGRATQKQRNFLDQVAQSGGIALLASTPEGARVFIESQSK